MSGITEGVVEEACLEYFRAMGYRTLYGPDLGPGGLEQERSAWNQVLLLGRLRAAIERINPSLESDAVASVVAAVVRPESQSPIAENLRLHRLLTQGVAVEYREPSGGIRHALVLPCGNS